MRDEEHASVLSRPGEARDVLLDEPEADVLPAMLGRDADGVDADCGAAGDVRRHGRVGERRVGGERRADVADECAARAVWAREVRPEEELGGLGLSVSVRGVMGQRDIQDTVDEYLT